MNEFNCQLRITPYFKLSPLKMYKIIKQIFVIRVNVEYLIKLVEKATRNSMEPNKYDDVELHLLNMKRCPQYIIQ